MPTIHERIEALWNTPSSTKLDWLKLETLQRDILSAAKHRTDLGDHSRHHSADYYLRAIDEALAAFTRRGAMFDPFHDDDESDELGLAEFDRIQTT